jgi:hypothetical protein
MIAPDQEFRWAVGCLGAANLLYAVELFQLRRRPLWRAVAFITPSKVLPDPQRALSLGPPLLALLSIVLVASLLYWPVALPVVASLSFLALAILHHAQKTGMEGSDQVRLWLTGALTAVHLMPVDIVGSPIPAYLLCAAALASAFYAGSGIAKAFAPEWWSGAALTTALSTTLFGHEFLFDVLKRYRKLARFLSATIILWELTFPLAVLLSLETAIAYLAAAIVFHLAVAIFMRLPMFIPAALAMAPGVLFIAETLHGE